MYLTQKALNQASFYLVYRSQQTHFVSTIKLIENEGRIPLSNKLAKLGPILLETTGITDLSGNVSPLKLLRLSGRLKNAEHLSFDMKHPMVLHPDDPFTVLVIQYYHRDVLLHTGGIKCLMCSLNQMYWIAASINSIKKLLNTCVKCRKLKARPMTQQMAPLPECRIPGSLNRVTPFETTALDCAGPWEVKIGRRIARPKRYMLIFRCATYGAIHIEMLTDMSTNCFLLALDRFCSIRSTPKTIICDQGTNFIGADGILKKVWDEMPLSQLQKVRPKIEFSFNPPLSPHFNGLIERMVQSAKKILKAILPDGPHEETLQTCFYKAAAFLNNRPIGYHISSSDDLEALTPNHFLGGGIHTEFCVPFELGGNLAIRFRKLNDHLDEFWKRLVSETTPYLRKYNKWLTKRENLQKGDICVLLDPTDRNKYPLCKVEEVKTSSDGLVRSATIKLKASKGFATKTLNRSVSNLFVVLPSTAAIVPILEKVDQEVPLLEEIDQDQGLQKKLPGISSVQFQMVPQKSGVRNSEPVFEHQNPEKDRNKKFLDHNHTISETKSVQKPILSL
jgi:hypothetical protein